MRVQGYNSDLSAHRIGVHDLALVQALGLIREAFAYMDGIIDPPSSVHRLTLAALQAPGTEVWAIGRPIDACMVLTPKPTVLYVGKLAVAEQARRRRLGTILLNAAEERARELGLGYLELQTRVELTGNQAAFVAMGFAEVARTAHDGYARVTSITYRRAVRGMSTA